MNIKVAILGDGGWGTALAIVLLKKRQGVVMWGPDAAYLRQIARTHLNRKFLKGVHIPAGLKVEGDINRAIREAEVIVSAIPSKYLSEVIRKIDRRNLRGKVFLSATKGFDHKTLKRPTEIIAKALKLPGISVLSGPTIAKEVALGAPSAAVIASRSRKNALLLQTLFSGKSFRLYQSSDIIGVELGGALKNVIAIAAGISDGLGFGSNTKAALITRGIREMMRLARILGGRMDTLEGLSGFGDLITTCISPESRNRSLGFRIGRGGSLKKILQSTEMVFEGVLTVRSAFELARKHKVEMPITEEIYKVLYRNGSPRFAVENLMARSLKQE